MKYSQESSLETVYQEMLDSIYKAAKQNLSIIDDDLGEKINMFVRSKMVF